MVAFFQRKVDIITQKENNILFLVNQGFDKYEKTIKNYFIDMADEKIIDGDLLLVLICIIIQKI